jgi:sarcosine oxidase
MNFDCVVLGAGINGLATAHALLRQGVTSLAVLEQFYAGHGQGSSHGRSRITRSTYSSPKYVELMQRVHAQLWPQWEEEAGQRLLHPTPGLFFGPGVDHYGRSMQAVPEVLSQIEEIGPQAARQRFFPFLFPDSDKVLVDHTCAVVAADRTMKFLTRRLRDHLRENCQVHSLHSRPGGLELQSNLGTVHCEKLVITAGPWTSRLLPELQPRLRPAHQDVGYFQLESPGPTQVGVFPVWVYAGQQADESFYGLPEFERPGLKLARHRTGAHADDPDRPISEHLPEAAAQDLLEFARHQWGSRVELVGYDACMYTNTVSEDFVLDHWPEDRRVVVGAGFSGHGFKFAPLTGQVLAELALHGRTSLAEFERHRPHFGLAAAAAW